MKAAKMRQERFEGKSLSFQLFGSSDQELDPNPDMNKPHHINADRDPLFHFDADPNPTRLCGSGSDFSL
jgi:hypothetical protein